MLLFIMGINVKTMAQENPESQQIKKEIRTVVIKDGVKTVMDTVIYDGDAKVLQFHGDKSNRRMIVREERMAGDSGKQVMVTVTEMGPGEEDVMMYDNGRRGTRRMISRLVDPAMPRVQSIPGAQTFRFRSQQSSNIIDLAAPGVISFKKKKMSGGREKITVIRQEVKEENVETFQYQLDNQEDLKKMNEPRVVRELDIRRKDLPTPPEVPDPQKK